MSSPCPPELDLMRLVDNDLVPEDHERVRTHSATCSRCGEQVAILKALLVDLRAVPQPALSLETQRERVMARIRSTRPQKTRVLAWLSVASSAAAGLVLAWFIAGDGHDGLQARGGNGVRSLSRDVAVQLYVQESKLEAVAAGDHLSRNSRFTVGLRNLGATEAYVMVLLIDSANTLHWVTPDFQRADEDPSSTPLPSAQLERTLPTSVAFDDLASGPLRAVSLISPRPLQVSALERLPKSALSNLALGQHFPDTEVRELALDIVPAP